MDEQLYGDDYGVQCFSWVSDLMAWFGRVPVSTRLRQEVRSSEGQIQNLDTQLAKYALAMSRHGEAVRKHAADGSHDLAHHAALEYGLARTAFKRVSNQKHNLASATNRLRELQTAVSLDRTLVTLCKGMIMRSLAMNPAKFTRVLAKIDELRTKNAVTEEQFYDFMIAEDEQEVEAMADHTSEEQRVQQIYMDLQVDIGPPAPSHEPREAVQH